MPATNEPQLVWRPQEGKQAEALRWRIFELFYGGARGGGKSAVGRAWMTIDIKHPQYRGLVIRKNTSDLTDWLDKARSLYVPMGAQVIGNPAEIRFPWGAIIRTGHLKDDNAYEKYQGHEYQRMNIEELTQINTEENYLKLLSSCRSTIPELKPRIFASGNPGGPGHEWVKKRFIDVCPPMTKYVDPVTGRGRVFIPATIEDNPILTSSDPGYIRFLDGLPEKLRKAWRDGNWDVFAGQYFSEWDRAQHVVEPFPIPQSWLRFRSIDPSGRSGTTSCHWYALDSDGTVWVYREHHKSGLDYDDHAKEIRRLSEDRDGVVEDYRYTVMDTAAFAKAGYSETAAEIYERHGVTGLIPAAKERVIGWNAVHQYLRWSATEKPKLRVFSTCPEFIRTIPLLQHDELHPEDVDTTGEDHAADELRYFLRTLREAKAQKPESAIERRLRQIRESSDNDFDYSYRR